MTPLIVNVSTNTLHGEPGRVTPEEALTIALEHADKIMAGMIMPSDPIGMATAIIDEKLNFLRITGRLHHKIQYGLAVKNLRDIELYSFYATPC